VYCGVAYRFENDEFDAYSRITVRVGVQF
jgi:hypothetical protein